MKPEIVLKSGKIALPTGITEADLLIKDGQIAGIVKTLNKSVERSAEQSIDCNGKLVIPGGIDFHAHIMDMGYSEREDWETGTQAAAAGGTTLVVGHGQTNPPSTTPENFEKIRSAACEKAVVDFRINGNITRSNIGKLGELVEEGVTTFGEIYMAESIPELDMIKNGTLWEAFREISSLDSIAGVHAEDWEIISHLSEKMKEENRTDPLAHPKSRPVIAEEEAVARALLFAKRTGVRLHVYHLTTEEGIQLVWNAKKKGQDITAEATTHHLLFQEKDMEEHGPYLKCNPPLRTERHQDALWRGLREGKIDMVTSDHYPLPKSEKECGWDDIWNAGAGMPGVGTRIPLLLTYGIKRNRISIQTFLKVVSENPARRLGIYPRKGAISVGSDADLVVLDLSEKTEIKAEESFSKCDHTPYEGREVVGMPSLTLVRGEVVMKNRKIISDPGYGRFT